MRYPPKRVHMALVAMFLVIASQLTSRLPQQFPASSAFAQAGNQTVVVPTAIPYSSAELVNPLRGLYRWRDQQKIDVVPGSNEDTFDDYERFDWRDLEGAAPATSDSEYDFSVIDQAIAAAVAATDAQGNPKPRQRLIFGVREQAGPGDIRLPAYLNTAQYTYIVDGRKYMMWNDSYFIERRRALFAALGRRYDGDPRVAMVQILGGQYGEWTFYSPGCRDTHYPTLQTKTALVDMVVDNFPTTRLVVGSQDSDIGMLGFQRSPRIGWFRNSLGDSSFHATLLQNYNPAYATGTSCNRTGTAAKWNTIRTRWRTAPVMTEFFSKSNPADVTPLLEQAVSDGSAWHVSQVSNGNVGPASVPLSSSQEQTLRTIGKNAGYRIVLARIAFPSTIAAGEPFSLTADWRNDGIAPPYEPWSIVYQLRPAGAPPSTAPAWEGSSAETLENLITQQYNDETFQPTGPNTPTTVTDSFAVPQSLAGGSYDISVLVRDPNARATPAPAFVRAPMKLAIEGLESDGSYRLGTVTVQSTVPEPSASSTPPPSPSPSPSPTSAPTLTPTMTPAPTMTPTPTMTSSPVPSPSPTLTPTPTATTTPSPTATTMPSPTATPQTTARFDAVADAYVRGGVFATTRYGTAAALEAHENSRDEHDRITYMRFDLSSLPATAASRALLTFQVAALSDRSRPSNIAVYAVTADGWSEATINWNNRPATSGPSLAAVSIATGQASIDLAAYVSEQLGGDKVVSLAIVGIGNNHNLATIASRNNTSGMTKPQLHVTPAQRIAQPAAADASVRAGASQGQNYGSAAVLEVKDSPLTQYDRQTYMRFDLRSLSASSVQRATLRLYYDPLVNGRPAGVQVLGVASDTWTENGIVWTNKPATGAALAAATIPINRSAWVELDLTTYVNAQLAAANDKQASFALLDTTLSDSLISFHSRENTANKPVLTLIVP